MSTGIIQCDLKWRKCEVAGTPADWFTSEEALAVYRKLHADLPAAKMRIPRRVRMPSSRERSGPLIFAGPWVGEFGWEITRWQAGVRKAASELGDCRVIVAGYPGRHALYEYADEYWELPEFFLDLLRQGHYRPSDYHLVEGSGPAGLTRALMALLWALARELDDVAAVARTVLPQRLDDERQLYHRLLPSERARSLMRPITQFPAGYVCIAPRGLRFGSKKNWSPHKWRELAWRIRRSSDLGVIAVGLPEEVVLYQDGPFIPWPAGIEAIDRVDCCLALLEGARAAVCSEGGGIFLSLFAGTPTLAFGAGGLRKIVDDLGNPIGTPFYGVQGGEAFYDHSVEDVFLGLYRFFALLDQAKEPRA